MATEKKDDLIDLGAATTATLGVPLGRDEDFVSETEMD